MSEPGACKPDQKQGSVYHSIASLTTSLVEELLSPTVLTKSIAVNIFAKNRKVVLHCKSSSNIFGKNR